MKRRLLLTIAIYVALTIIFLIAKCLFVAVNHGIYAGTGIRDLIDVIWHGLPMDLSTAGYLTVVPALIIVASAFSPDKAVLGRWLVALKTLLVVSALVIALGVSADTMLYPHWGFKLDTTPLFYFLSSPSSAMASGGIGLGIVLMIGIWIGASILFLWTVNLIRPHVIAAPKRRWSAAVCLILCSGLLILPIRGGVGVSTMNLSRSYFSPDTRLNHAAVNPLFSFLYSATHQQDFGKQFRYFKDNEAEAVLKAIQDATTLPDSDTALPPLIRDGVDKPDIYIVILESFSSHIVPSLGGAEVAVRLDSVAMGGWSWTECYASSFRTDRALPAILSGYPGQPTTSIMKFASKTENLPSLPSELKKAGYELRYYYGGDINLTGMNTYLVSAGFDNIISDKDFPLYDRLSKWGVPDHLLFARHLSDIRKMKENGSPRFTVIQTSSSHEPFDVPYQSCHADKRLNAFAYTDHHTGEWLEAMKRNPRWDRTLVVLVADHFAVWPDNLTDQGARHHIPLVITGGALNGAPQVIGDPVSQTDIAATLLGALGLDRSKFIFSNDLFSPGHPRTVFFSDTEHATLLTPRGYATINLTSGLTESTDSLHAGGVKAYLQMLYTDLQNR